MPYIDQFVITSGFKSNILTNSLHNFWNAFEISLCTHSKTGIKWIVEPFGGYHLLVLSQVFLIFRKYGWFVVLLLVCTLAIYTRSTGESYVRFTDGTWRWTRCLCVVRRRRRRRRHKRCVYNVWSIERPYTVWNDFSDFLFLRSREFIVRARFYFFDLFLMGVCTSTYCIAL